MAEIYWRVDRETYFTLRRLFDELDFEEPGSEPYEQLREQIRRLPGFPSKATRFHPRDHLRIQLVESPRVISLPKPNGVE